MADILDDWHKKAMGKRKENRDYLKKVSKKRGMEKYLPDLHEEAFSKIRCLDCAGCCTNISPRFKTPDISRIAKYLRIKESHLIEQYLRLDEDGDYVVQRSPCPFLGEGNMCSIYEARPGDCRRYPYTDSGDFFAYASTTHQNSVICPAVYYVLERLKQIVS
jgi:Fe-S-cluster containining protein